MSLWNLNMWFAFGLSIVFTRIIIPQILLISFRKRLFDGQSDRKIHKGIVPRLGGIAFMPSIFFSLLLLAGINIVFTGQCEVCEEIKNNILELSFESCGIIILYLIGIADDLIGVRYKEKFIAQIICGILLVASGLWINNLYGIFGIYELHPLIGYPLTIFAVVFIMNAINLIDGIDGLASGLSGVALIFFGFIFLHLQIYLYALLAFAALGTLIPFFYYNVFGNASRGARKIFMGDTGALTIGFILCILFIKLSHYEPSQINQISNAIALACALLITPCFDVIRVVIHRFRTKKHLFMPDKNHIHHKLLETGMSQKYVMMTIIVISIIFAVFNLLLVSQININILLAINIVVWTISNIWLTYRIKRKQTALTQKLKHP